MNSNRRANLRNVIGAARKIIEKDFATQLLRLGINQNGQTIPLTKLSEISSKIKIRKDLEDALRKERSAVSSDREAIQRYIRQAGSTFMNRLAAIRALEVRELVPEAVIQRNKFGGYSLRGWGIAEADPSLTPPEVREKALKEAFSEISQQIRTLFEQDDEYSFLFPSPKAVKDLISLFSDEITEEDWSQDDIIGWIYQYYNEEARVRFKKSRRALSTDDVPIVNQFYTPHWVVRLLTDNTLGRLWLEQKGRCPYLKCEADRPQFTELCRFEHDIDSHNSSLLMNIHHEFEPVDSFCSYFLPSPREPRPRAAKKVREIKVLDPACGSGHFLIYAFDVLYRMYVEDEPQINKKMIPQLILENNLYGVDVDLRAVQLAALSLYLKAKSYDRDIKISKMNLVCADSHIANSEKREEFLERFEGDPALAAIFRTLFEKLNHTNELGSLLKVRTPFEELFEERKKQVQAHFLTDDVQSIASNDRCTSSANAQEKWAKNNQKMAIPGKRAVEEMITELHRFERECLERQDMGSMIFATEAEKSIGLLSLLSQKYDVILMNPPYGDQPKKSKEYLKKNYPKTHHDYSAAFIEQAANLIEKDGYIGGLVTRSFMFLKSYQWLRETLLTKETTLESVFDLGFGVLEGATARWAAFITQRADLDGLFANDSPKVTFLRLTEAKEEAEKIKLFENTKENIATDPASTALYFASTKDLSKIPGTPYCYWISNSIRELFSSFPPLDKGGASKEAQVKIADVRQGLITSDNERFTRQYWEVPLEAIKSGRWVPFANKGGSSRFYADNSLCVNWENNGAELRAFEASVIRNDKYSFREAVGCPKVVSSPCLSFRKLAADAIFGVAIVGIFPVNNKHILPLLALGNSCLFVYLFRALDELSHDRNPGYLSRLPINVNGLNSIKLISAALEAYYLLKAYYTGLEVSSLFTKPWLLQVADPNEYEKESILDDSFANNLQLLDWSHIEEIHGISGASDMSLRQLANLCIKRQEMRDIRMEEIQRTIDEEVFDIYAITDEDRELIQRSVSGGLFAEDREHIEGDKHVPVNKSSENVKYHVVALISYYIKQAIDEDDDGIVPLNDSFENSLIKRVRTRIAQDFGANRARSLIEELEEILGSTLDNWIINDYFDYHVDLYKRRPIYWQLTSKGLAKSRHDAIAFSCFVNYHKLTKDTLPKIIELYLKRVKRSAATRHENLKREFEQIELGSDRSKFRNLSEALKDAQAFGDQLESFENELMRVIKPSESFEITSKSPTWFDEKVREISANGWNPMLDYGVLVNMQPLKKANLLPASAIKVK